MDAASFPMGADSSPGTLAGPSTGRLERGHEHPVRPVAVRPEAMPERGCALARARRLDRSELRTVTDDRVARGVRLRARERADRIDEASARAQQFRPGGRDRDLQAGEPGELVSLRPPEQLGTATSGADPGAR